MRQELEEAMVLTEDKKKQILENGRREAQSRKRRLSKTRHILCGLAVLATVSAAILPALPQRQGQDMPVTVYAQEPDGQKKIPIGDRQPTPLERTETPLGEGYQLNIDSDKEYQVILAMDGDDKGADTVFLDGSHIYWVPDSTKDSKASVSFRVYDRNGQLLQEINVKLLETEEGTTVEMG